LSPKSPPPRRLADLPASARKTILKDLSDPDIARLEPDERRQRLADIVCGRLNRASLNRILLMDGRDPAPFFGLIAEAALYVGVDVVKEIDYFPIPILRRDGCETVEEIVDLAGIEMPRGARDWWIELWAGPYHHWRLRSQLMLTISTGGNEVKPAEGASSSMPPVSAATVSASHDPYATEPERRAALKKAQGSGRFDELVARLRKAGVKIDRTRLSRWRKNRLYPDGVDKTHHKRDQIEAALPNI
jgi:hypothetical protein